MINRGFFNYQKSKRTDKLEPVFCGVITNNKEKGDKMMEHILSLFGEREILRITKQRHPFIIDILLKDETVIVYTPASPSIKGYKFTKAIIDEDLSDDEYCDIATSLILANNDIIYF